MPDDAATILDIVNACRRLMRFTAQSDEHAFLAEEEKRWASLSQLLIIGEAVNRLSEGFRSNHAQIPWPQIAAMRNRLIHGYDKINWQLVWRTIERDVPFLIGELEALVPGEEPPPDAL
jgi:uncharacterized protein with HEPN domain